MSLIYAQLRGGQAAAVILNGVVVYSEDDDPGYSQNFTALEVCRRLQKSLKMKARRVTVTIEQAGGTEWNIGDMASYAIEKIRKETA